MTPQQSQPVPQRPPVDRIGQVHVFEWRPDRRGITMLGYISVQWGDLIIRRMTLHFENGRYSIGVPRQRHSHREEWEPVIDFIDPATAHDFRQAVLRATFELFASQGEALPV